MYFFMKGQRGKSSLLFSLSYSKNATAYTDEDNPEFLARKYIVKSNKKFSNSIKFMDNCRCFFMSVK